MSKVYGVGPAEILLMLCIEDRNLSSDIHAGGLQWSMSWLECFVQWITAEGWLAGIEPPEAYFEAVCQLVDSNR